MRTYENGETQRLNLSQTQLHGDALGFANLQGANLGETNLRAALISEQFPGGYPLERESFRGHILRARIFRRLALWEQISKTPPFKARI